MLQMPGVHNVWVGVTKNGSKLNLDSAQPTRSMNPQRRQGAEGEKNRLET